MALVIQFISFSAPLLLIIWTAHHFRKKQAERLLSTSISSIVSWGAAILSFIAVIVLEASPQDFKKLLEAIQTLNFVWLGAFSFIWPPLTFILFLCQRIFKKPLYSARVSTRTATYSVITGLSILCLYCWYRVEHQAHLDLTTTRHIESSDQTKP